MIMRKQLLLLIFILGWGAIYAQGASDTLNQRDIDNQKQGY